jgi:hypothetical protein
MRAFHRHHRRRRVLRATSVYLAILAVFGVGVLWFRTHSAPSPIAKQSVAITNTNSRPTGEQEKSAEPGVVGTASRQSMQPRRLKIPLFAKAGTASSARRSSSSRRRETASQATTAQKNPAIQGLFVALPSFAFCAPDEELRVIRVNMPTSSLRLLGAPIDEESITRRVTTDLLIGSDGTPYAVRLVM